MNRKKIILLLVFVIIIGVLIYFVINNISISKTSNDILTDYTPQEEISDEQLRQTSIALYFVDKASGELKSENKTIDSTQLLSNPYTLIIQKILDGPADDSLASPFPENTKILDASLTGSCVIINFSEELLNYENDSQKFNIINCILNSLTQLTEVNSIKILINNEPHDGINEEYCPIS